MKKITAKTLQDALLLASEEFQCSVVDLEYEVAQNPSAGILGIGRKDAVIVVDYKKGIKKENKVSNEGVIKQKEKMGFRESKQPLPPDTQSYPNDTQSFENNAEVKTNQDIQKEQYEEVYSDFNDNLWGDSHLAEQGETKERVKHTFQNTKDIKEYNFVDSAPIKSTHIAEELDKNVVASDIERELKELFSHLPFEIDYIKVIFVNDELCITIDGRDCALLIGEKGYRYKALSYLLFNWINTKYGVSVRLEVAEFLKNQEQMIDVYLEGIIEQVNATSKAQTKPLDGILAYIALGKLREVFPQKYVSFRLNEEGEKYIIINDFKKS